MDATAAAGLSNSQTRDERKSGGTASKERDDQYLEELKGRAEAALASARQALEVARERAPVRPQYGEFVFQSRPDNGLRSTSRSSGSRDAEAGASTDAALRGALERMSGDDLAADLMSDSSDMPADGGQQGQGVVPSWAEGLSDKGSAHASYDRWASEPQLQAASQSQAQHQLDYAEPELATLNFAETQSQQDAAWARNATLPPLQSVVEMTTAHRPPARGEEPVTASSSAGHAMKDGHGQLADGTQWDRQSGEEFGPNGYWFRWHRLSGKSGKVEWEEYWWEASDWGGMKEMGAEKSGCSAEGAAWRETWREALAFDQATGEPTVERTAHKWAQDAKGDEWEEKWGEWWASLGRANKWADKWGKDGPNVWHEKWGEDYDGEGGCIKYTDKWAERMLPGGATEEWGDKWEERFKDGKGSKTGETWSVDAGRNRFQRWWGENHGGNGWVQKYGNSNTGEQWDVSEQMDTYYNPIPVGGYTWAVNHSPQLNSVPVRPRGGDDLEGGIDAL